MKLAVSLLAADFKMKSGGECTRILRDGKESFTWHFSTTNAHGQDIAAFLKAWENPVGEGKERPEAMVCFLLAQEAMLSRHHILSESHKVPVQSFRQRGENRLFYTPKLKPEDRTRLARMAS